MWSFRERHCSVSFPYYEEATNLCYDLCPAGYVNELGPTKKYCASCDEYKAGCELCNEDGSVCSKCWGYYELDEVSNTCNCPDGHYISDLYREYVDICRPCHDFC